MIRRILVGLSGTPYSSVAIRTGVELACRHGAELTGVTIVDTRRLAQVSAPGVDSYAANELRQHRFTLTRQHVEAAVGEFRDACQAAHLTHQVRHEERETPFDYMISQARYHDLIVMGLRGLMNHDIIGERYDEPASMLARLITGGARPIIAVGPQHQPVRKVMIAYSGSIESAKTMKRFVQLRPWPDVIVHLVTFEHTAERAQRLLSDAAEYCKAHGLDVDVEYVPESPKRQLLPHAARRGADLIVLGNSARRLLLRQMMGETALHAMANADRPLFLGQ